MMKNALIIMSLLLALMCTPVFALELTTLKGKATNLQQLVGRGKWSIVVFWSHSCQICAQETPAINDFYFQHKDRDTRVIGVSIDGVKNQPLVEGFISDTGMQFPSFIAELPIMTINFAQITEEQFKGTPTFLIYNRRGRVVAMQAGKLKMQALERFISGR